MTTDQCDPDDNMDVRFQHLKAFCVKGYFMEVQLRNSVLHKALETRAKLAADHPSVQSWRDWISFWNIDPESQVMMTLFSVYKYMAPLS